MTVRDVASVSFVLALLLLSAAGCATGDGFVSLPGGGDETVPRAVVRELQIRWPGAELGPVPTACPGGAPAAPILRADFNGDGSDDMALGVAAAGATRLAVAFARLDGAYAVEEVGEALLAGPLSLTVARRGSPYRPASSVVDFFFGADTFVAQACDGSRTAWIWTGSSFRSQPLAN